METPDKLSEFPLWDLPDDLIPVIAQSASYTKRPGSDEDYVSAPESYTDAYNVWCSLASTCKRFNLLLEKKRDGFFKLIDSVEQFFRARSADELISVTRYCRLGKLYRDGDLPAEIHEGHKVTTSYWFKFDIPFRHDDKPTTHGTNGLREWRDKRNNLHRDNDLPAQITPNGVKRWYIHGTLMRYNDKPVIERSNGKKVWYLDGKIGRANDLPAEECPNGQLKWYTDGRLERGGDKPAVIVPGKFQEWVKRGKYHRGDDKPAIVWDNGRQEWYVNGVLDRGNDMPAVITSSGTQKWYKKGVLDRGDDKPAVIKLDGTRKWYKNGVLDRDGDQPAVIIKTDEILEWHKDGRLHRGGGKPARVCKDGAKVFFVGGLLHRERGPAITRFSGIVEHRYNGRLHCDCGPAKIFPDGTFEFWWHGQPMQFDTWRRIACEYLRDIRLVHAARSNYIDNVDRMEQEEPSQTDERTMQFMIDSVMLSRLWEISREMTLPPESPIDEPWCCGNGTVCLHKQSRDAKLKALTELDERIAELADEKHATYASEPSSSSSSSSSSSENTS